MSKPATIRRLVSPHVGSDLTPGELFATVSPSSMEIVGEVYRTLELPVGQNMVIGRLQEWDPGQMKFIDDPDTLDEAFTPSQLAYGGTDADLRGLIAMNEEIRTSYNNEVAFAREGAIERAAHYRKAIAPEAGDFPLTETILNHYVREARPSLWQRLRIWWRNLIG